MNKYYKCGLLIAVALATSLAANVPQKSVADDARITLRVVDAGGSLTPASGC